MTAPRNTSRTATRKAQAKPKTRAHVKRPPSQVEYAGTLKDWALGLIGDIMEDDNLHCKIVAGSKEHALLESLREQVRLVLESIE